MSQAFENFITATEDVKELIKCFDDINSTTTKPAPDALKRAALIMILTAWETYVEDVATEIFHRKFDVLSGSHVGNYLDKNFRDELKQFNNPDSRKTKHLFQHYFGVDVTAKWIWGNYDPDSARTHLNKWIKKRGAAVHRIEVGSHQPHAVKRDELEKCLRFFCELVTSTENALLKA